MTFDPKFWYLSRPWFYVVKQTGSKLLSFEPYVKNNNNFSKENLNQKFAG